MLRNERIRRSNKMNVSQVTKDLFQLVQSNEVMKIKEILELNPLLANSEDENGLTALGFAAHFGYKETVEVLLSYGADVNAVSRSKVEYIPSNTALHAAIAGKRDHDVISLLLEHNARTDIFDSNGHTSLHTAAFHDDNIEIINLLVSHGAQIHAEAKNGETALDLAIKKGNKQVCEQICLIAEQY
jgi:ankyrin repeat protein